MKQLLPNTKSKLARPTHELPALEALRVNCVIERAKARFSQGDLAARSGVSRPTISRIERGSVDVRIGIVERLAKAFGITVAALLDGTIDDGPIDDDKLVELLNSPPEDFIDADDFIRASDEADGLPFEPYSRAGRPPMARKSPSKRH